MFVLKLKFSPRSYGRRLVAEMWLLPGRLEDPRAVDEVPPAEAFQVAAETRAFLEGLGLTCHR